MNGRAPHFKSSGRLLDEWLEPAPGATDPTAVRDGYRTYLTARLAAADAWLPRRAAA